MSAFKPTRSSALAEPVVPSSRPEFEAIFSEDLVRQIERIVADAIDKKLSSKSFFREQEIINLAQTIAQKEMKEEVLGHTYFKVALEWAFRQHPMLEIDHRTKTLTTPETWAMEQEMLAMAGEKTTRHLAPEKLVDDALASRSMVEAKALPPDFVQRLWQQYPRQAGQATIETRVVVAAAREWGFETYGLDLEWNRLGSSALPDDMVGQAEEFLASIEEEEKAGQSWFVKPALFLSDDLSSPAALKLQEKARQASTPVVFAPRVGMSKEQVDAVLTCTLTEQRVPVVEGTAGSGKSYTMKSVCEVHQAMGYEIIGTALGWSAAKVLGGSTGLSEKNCKALSGFLKALRAAKATGAEYFTRPTLIIVDEAGMVGSRFMHALFKLTRDSKYPVKIVLTGDSLQLSPVEAGGALEAIVAYHGTTRIDTIRRQKQASHRWAVKRLSERRAGEALHPFLHQEALRWCTNEEDVYNKVVRDFVSYRAAFPGKKILALTLKNKDVAELNRRIRMVFKKSGLIDSSEVGLDVTDGQQTWSAGFSIGDEVVLRSNDRNLPVYYIPEPGTGDLYDESTWGFKTTGVFNRNCGKIVGIRRCSNPAGSYDFIVDLEGEDSTRVIVNSQKFKHPDRGGMPMVHNYATTMYASQGMTVPEVLLLDSDRMNFRLAYVAMSRHTDNVRIYLNEADLHARLDNKMNKSPSRNVARVDPSRVEVETGRYSREHMLQTVALGWGSMAKNQTAVMFARQSRLEQAAGRDAVSDEANKVKRALPSELVTDFLASTNLAYPEVDIQKILSLPDPLSDSEFVRPSDAEENRTAVPTYESPVRVIEGPLPSLKDLPEEGEGLFSRTTHWLSRHLGLGATPPKPAEPEASAAQAKGHVKPSAAFGGPPSPPQDGVLGKVKSAIGALLPRPKGLFWLPVTPPLGFVDDQGVLRFDNVPQTQAEAGVIPAPSDGFLSSGNGRMWWAIGRGGEPRVLARSADGEVVARYALDGRCAVGDGFPPIAFAPKPSESTPIHIVPGAREWFLLQELYREKFKTQPDQEPHVIWGARDVDWRHVAAGIRGRKVIIMRSRHDEAQLPWALDLEKELRERWGISANVVPKPPEPAPPAPSRSGPRGP